MTVIRIESSNKSFSVLGGLHIGQKLMSHIGLKQNLETALPVSQKLKLSSWSKFESLVLGFQAGAQCLDDWDELSGDEGFEETLTRSYSSKSLGDYLRSFSSMQTIALKRNLIDLSFRLRSNLQSDEDPFILDIDSSNNLQYGKKMEGVSYHYNGKTEGLDTLYAFDELGFQYWHDVRKGSTFTSQNCGQVIYEVISRMPKTQHFKNKRKIIRADSGFCNSELMNTAISLGCGFVCMARQNTKLYQAATNIKKWDKTGMLAHDGRVLEIGNATVSDFASVKKHLRVVAMRAKKSELQRSLFEDSEYDYFVLVTNMGAHEYSNENIIKLYRKRGHAENFIKEQKYGFDLKHYPCQKLSANMVFGLISAFAYTLMRFMALSSPKIKKTKKGLKKIHQCSKAHRRKWLLLPMQIVRHAGEVVFRYSHKHFKEVKFWLDYFHKLQVGTS